MERAGGSRVVLCLLCGLPAAGKSTLSRALSRLLPPHQGWDCSVLAYDELIPQEAPGPPEPGWKRRRREVLRQLERRLRGPPGPAAQRGLPEPGAAPRPLCIVLDDNFYYRSMRYEVYQLARKYSLSFCQLFLEGPLEQCLRRNHLRSHPLPDETIRLMATRIEPPDPKKNTWEQNSLVLKSPDCPSEDEYDAVLMKGCYAQIIDLLATALENPVKQNEENTEQKEADRVACAASTVHQADQTCRRVISQTMKEAKDKNVLPSEMKSLAEELNKLKAAFLEDLRQETHLKNETGQQNHSFDPATRVFSSFQHEATSVVNKYILK
uniref:Phosphoseryl-tRNA kinase n=1 Tax=Cairina moschata TaxID=8855 RepID=A0A8C3C6X8_CAIMO